MQVTAKRNSSSGLSVKLWTSSGSRPVNSSDPSSPIRLYAEVKVGVAPVMNARVMAKLQRLGTNATGSNYRPIQLDLWDNGIGGELFIVLSVYCCFILPAGLGPCVRRLASPA